MTDHTRGLGRLLPVAVLVGGLAAVIAVALLGAAVAGALPAGALPACP